MKRAFTLAEVLITLGVIGVVSAMTIPTLIGKIEIKRTQIKLKKFYSVLVQATKLSMAENEEMSGWNTSLTAKAFYDTYYANYLKTLHRYDASDSLIYLTLMDGTCAIFRKNGSTNDISGFYWKINTNCGKGPQMEGVTIFELCIYNLVEAPIFCPTSARPCRWYTDNNYYDSWRRYFLSDSTFKGYCGKGSSGYGWKSLECYLKFIHDDFKFSKDYDFQRVKRSYSPSYSKPINDKYNYWLRGKK